MKREGIAQIFYPGMLTAAPDLTESNRGKK